MLHEVILALSGHPGILFSEEGKRNNVISYFHPSERVLLDRIAHVAADYLTLQKFIEFNNSVGNVACGSDSCNLSMGSGDYMRAFCNALNDVLQPYREDILALEKEVLNDPFISLSHVTYCAEKRALFLNLLNKLVKQLTLEGLRGCQILGLLRRQWISGVDEFKDAIGQILRSCHQYFYKQLTCWLLYGYLMDRHKEFFIQHLKDSYGVSEVKKDSILCSTGNAGEKKNLYPAFCDYEIDFSMLPAYIPASVAYKILFIGQTILMFSNDSDENNSSSKSQKGNMSVWSGKEEDFLKKLQLLEQEADFNIDKFEATVNEIRTCVTEHLWCVAVEKAELFQQLRLMKDFFLLGRGELFLEFIQQMGSVMSKVSVSAREVNQAFQIAARKVLLTDEAALDKFYFVVQSKEQSVGDKCKATVARESVSWDHINLSYKVSWPLHLLFTAETLDYYNILFKFLLRVKKVQAYLHSTWMDHIKASKQVQGKMFQSTVWQLRTGLTFLVDNLQYYLQADVLESQYAQMQNSIQNTQDFEKVQQAHALFQSNILSQTFLQINSSSSQTDSKWSSQSVGIPNSHRSGASEMNHVHRSLDRILTLCENFCECLHKWNDPLNEEELQEFNEMDYEFSTQVHFLMQLLFILRSEPCGSHLSQLLLRLDFNRWFSNSSSFVYQTKSQDFMS